MIAKEGDVVKVDDPIITLETDKAAMDVPSPYPGKVIAVYANKGDKINQGDNLCLIDVDLSLVNHQNDELAAIITEASKEIEKSENTLASEKTSKENEASNFISKSFSGVHASPSVRKLARELGVDLTEITAHLNQSNALGATYLVIAAGPGPPSSAFASATEGA